MTTLYKIIAKNREGNEVVCYTWRGNPDDGIAIAKRDAAEWRRHDLHSFRAQPVNESL